MSLRTSTFDRRKYDRTVSEKNIWSLAEEREAHWGITLTLS